MSKYLPAVQSLPAPSAVPNQVTTGSFGPFFWMKINRVIPAEQLYLFAMGFSTWGPQRKICGLHARLWRWGAGFAVRRKD